MKHQYEKEIGGKVYTIRMFSPTKSTVLFAKLVKLIGPSLALMADVNKDVGNEGEFLSKALTALAGNLKEDEFEALLKDLLRGAIHNGQPVGDKYDAHFMEIGGIAEAFLIAGEVIKHNYKDFLSVLPGGKDLLAMVQKQ